MTENSEDYGVETTQKTKKDKKKVIGGLLLGAIPLLFILYLVLGPVLHILSKDLKAKEMYVISEFTSDVARTFTNSEITYISFAFKSLDKICKTGPKTR